MTAHLDTAPDSILVAGLRLTRDEHRNFAITHGDIRISATHSFGRVIVEVSVSSWDRLDRGRVSGLAGHDDPDVAFVGAIAKLVEVAAPAISERVVRAIVALQVAALEAAEVAA